MESDEPRLTWEVSSAYDLFISLEVLYNPGRYGLRGAWAAGVRSRLPAPARETLRQATSFLFPLAWLHGLPPPKDGQTALDALAQIAAEERLEVVMFYAKVAPPEWASVLRQVSERRAWDEDDLAALRAAMGEKKSGVKKKDLSNLLQSWSQPEVFGERFLEALCAYYDVFFAEEEKRILPYLEAAAAAAKALAAKMRLVPLLEELSQGLTFSALPALREMVLAPSFWSTPLVVEQKLDSDRLLFLFGARPLDVSLVPGELVPEDLHRALKALADPTRLRILHYLAAEPMSPSRLARQLRLRAPTVVHHLHTLRLARLVQLTMEAEGRKRYSLRPGVIEATVEALQLFLEEGGGEEAVPEEQGGRM